MELGKDIEDSVIEDKISAQKPNQCALLVYTVRACAKQPGELHTCFGSPSCSLAPLVTQRE